MNLVSHLAPRRLAVAATVVALIVTAAVTNPGSAGAATSEGLLCDTDAHQAFALTAQDGYVSTPAGTPLSL